MGSPAPSTILEINRKHEREEKMQEHGDKCELLHSHVCAEKQSNPFIKPNLCVIKVIPDLKKKKKSCD